MQRIALEEHFVLGDPEHVERWLTLIPGVSKAVLDRIQPILSDVGERRLEAMSKANIDFAVLSNVGSVQGVLDPSPAMRLARQANDALATLIQKHPARFGGFATVPLQRPEDGADELERAVRQMGMKGALIIGHTDGRSDASISGSGRTAREPKSGACSLTSPAMYSLSRRARSAASRTRREGDAGRRDREQLDRDLVLVHRIEHRFDAPLGIGPSVDVVHPRCLHWATHSALPSLCDCCPSINGTETNVTL